MSDPREAQKVLERWIAVQRYSHSVNKQLQAYSRRMIREILTTMNSQKTFLQKKRQISDITKKYKIDMYDQVITEMILFSGSVFKTFNKDAAELGLADQMKRKAVKESEVKAMIAGHSLYAQKGTVKQQFSKAFKSAGIQAINEMVEAQRNNVAIDIVKANVLLSSRLLNHITNLSSTIVNSVYNGTETIVFDQVNDIRYMWVSTLDHVTSPFCMLADGKIFKKGKGPRPPAHIGCRSIVIVIKPEETKEQVLALTLPRAAVVPKSVEALKEKGLTTRTGKKRRPSRNDHSPLKGTTTTKRTYEAFLKSQPKLYIEKILGRKAAEKFRSGDSLSAVLKNSKSSIDFSSLQLAIN